MESNDEFVDPFSCSRAPNIWERLGWSSSNLPLFTLVLLFVASNLFLPRLFRSEVMLGMAFFAAGALCAELAALATWLGLGAGSLVFRLAYTVPLVFVVAISYIIGIEGLDGPVQFAIYLFIVGIAIGGFFLLSIPLLIVRRIAKLAITRGGSASQLEETTFSIGSLLALTAIAAAVIAALKLFVADGDSRHAPSADDIWIMAWLCVHQTVSAILIFLPCFWLGITRRRKWVAFCCATAALAIVPAINVAVLRLYGNGFRDPEILPYTYTFSAGFGLTIIAVFSIVQFVGFEMRRRAS